MKAIQFQNPEGTDLFVFPSTEEPGDPRIVFETENDSVALELDDVKELVKELHAMIHQIEGN